MPESDEKPLVVIRSLVYNHEPYLRDCLEGFVMQQTTFPFVAVVHDDCSTDGSAAIIREYAEKYPHIIKPVYETENQYSKKDGSLRRVMDEACGKYGAKYIALCEGDDYWTDPLKLQKQVDFLETHPDYTMVCTNGAVRTPDGDLTEDDLKRWGWPQYAEECDIPAVDTITKGGWVIHTASIVYRYDLKDEYPAACRRRLAGGDLQLQIFAALRGKIHYFHDKMIVYRSNSGPASWSSNVWKKKDRRIIESWEADVRMFESLNEYSGHRYEKEFHYAAMKEIAWQVDNNRHLLPLSIPRVGHVFLFSRLAPYMQSNESKGIRATIKFRVLKCCYHPYYPQPKYDFLIRPCLRPFYEVSGPRRTIHVGPIGILSYVRQENGKDDVYVLGKRVKRARHTVFPML